MNRTSVHPLRSGEMSPPLTAVFGSSDKLVAPEESFETLNLVPTARSIVLEDCGHFIPIEHPEAVVAIVSQQIGLREGPINASDHESPLNYARLRVPSPWVSFIRAVRRRREAIAFWRWRAVLALLPLALPVLAVWILRGSGSLSKPGCGTLTIFHLVAKQPRATGTPCTSIVLSADLPNIFLGFAAVLMVILHFSWVRTYRKLFDELATSRLLGESIPESERDEVASYVSRESRPSSLSLLLLISGATALIVYFYYLTYHYGNLVTDLAKHQVGPDGSTHPEITGMSEWWADYHGWKHLIVALTWGLVAVSVICLGMYDQLRLRRLTRWLKGHPKSLTHDYSPIFRSDGNNSDSFGFRRLYTLAELKRWGGGLLLVALIIVFYLIRTPGSLVFNYAALLSVAVLGLVWYLPLAQLRSFTDRHLEAAVSIARANYAAALGDPSVAGSEIMRLRFEAEQITLLATAGNSSILSSWGQKAILSLTVFAAVAAVIPVFIGS